VAFLEIAVVVVGYAVGRQSSPAVSRAAGGQDHGRVAGPLRAHLRADRRGAVAVDCASPNVLGAVAIPAVVCTAAAFLVRRAHRRDRPGQATVITYVNPA
jgi:hypothetical protein